MAAATAVLGLGLVATTAAAAPPAGRAATTAPIIVYKGDAKGSYGPDGPLSPLAYKTTTEPGTIYTNIGKFTVDTALTYPGVTKGGYWWWKVSPNTVILHAFHWTQTNGDVVEAFNLQNILNNNNAWYTLADGTVAPRCMSYQYPSGTPAKYIQITKKNGDWKSTTKPCTTAP